MPESLGTVLIVEDDNTLRKLYQRALVLADFGVIQAGSGPEALELLQEHTPPELVMMDLNLPQMSGEEFLRALRSQNKIFNAKILIVSGSEDLAKWAQELGADGYLRKPVDLDLLQKEVIRLIGS